MRELTKTDVRRKAFKSIQYDLSELINPSDVTDNVHEWDNLEKEVLDREIWESIEIMLSERQEPWDSLIRDLSVILWRDSMPRISMDKLQANTHKEALAEGIWPNKVDKWEATDLLHEIGEPPHDCYREAMRIVEEGMYTGLHPLHGDSNE